MEQLGQDQGLCGRRGEERARQKRLNEERKDPSVQLLCGQMRHVPSARVRVHREPLAAAHLGSLWGPNKMNLHRVYLSHSATQL